MTPPLPFQLSIILGLFGAATAPAANVTWAGTVAGLTGAGNDEIDSWRTTSVTKTLDADGDNVYGTAGYVLYGTDAATNGNTGSVVASNPLTYAPTATRRTLSSVPSYLTLASSGQGHVASSYGYRLMDDPTLTPGASVADLESGGALRQSTTLGTEAAMITFTIAAGMPATGIRIGIITGNTDRYAGTLRFAQTLGGTASVSTPHDFTTGSDLAMTFFDITDAAEGDVFTLYIRKTSPQPTGGSGNANVIYGGLTFDVLPVPEPGSAMLATLAGGLAILRRRRRG